MPAPERPETPAGAEPDIPDEDAYSDAQAAREAKDEAESLNAVPYERHEHEVEEQRKANE